MLFFFSKLFTYLYMLVCVHFRGIFTLVHTMVNEFCSRSSDSCDCCFHAFIVMHLILDQSKYLLLLVHVYDGLASFIRQQMLVVFKSSHLQGRSS